MSPLLGVSSETVDGGQAMAMNSESTSLTKRPDSRELPGGWAGDLAWSGDTAWVAWTACHDPEPALLTYARQEWPLRPGRTVTEWRRRSAAARFTLSLARLDEPGGASRPGAGREPARHRRAGPGGLIATAGYAGRDLGRAAGTMDAA